ncbi:MAG: GNAT family N-acetyltransferase [Acidobacteriota bacterium]|nr:GNAT family N-acetyltransferase [Acidobacteriota bacterium]
MTTAQPILEIRDARREDLPAILALVAQDSMSHPGEAGAVTDAHYRAFEEIAAHPDHRLIVGTLAGEALEGEVVATLQLSYLPGLGFGGAWRAQLEAVRVRSDLRSRGIGAHIVSWAIDEARRRGCNLVQLTSNQARMNARRFYERLGFKASHIGMKLYL